MRRKAASIGEAGSSKVYCVYNQEDGIFEIVDARNQPLGGSCRLVDFDEFVESNPKTWRSRLRAVVEWVFTDLLAGFVSCSVSMNPHLFCMMYQFDDHIERSKTRSTPPDKS